MLGEIEGKDCFDICTIKECPNHGHEVFSPGYCRMDPAVDRYERRPTIKKPCNTCTHRDTRRPCSRCSHGQEQNVHP